MPYEFIYPWNKNPRLVGITFSGALHSKDMIEALEEASTLMDQALMPLHVVFDFSETMVNEELLNILKSSRMIQHKQRGYCVFIHPNEMVHFIAKIVRHETGIPIEFAASPDDVLEFFNEMGLF